MSGKLRKKKQLFCNCVSAMEAYTKRTMEMIGLCCGKDLCASDFYWGFVPLYTVCSSVEYVILCRGD